MSTAIGDDPLFQLVGSRYVRNHDPNSDWDYVAPNNELARQKLVAMGFVPYRRNKDEGRRYLDINTVQIWIKRSWRDRSKLVQVALVRDVEAKLRITEVLRLNPGLAAYDKSLKGTAERVALWDSFYTMVGIGEVGR